MSVSITEWLSGNTVLVSAYMKDGKVDFWWHEKHLRFIVAAKAKELINLFENNDEVYHKGRNAKNSYYITSRYGLIIVVEKINLTETVLIQKNLVLAMEIPITDFVAESSIYNKYRKDVSTDTLVKIEVERIKKLAEEKEKQDNRNAKIKSVKDDILAMSNKEGFTVLVSHAFNFDHSYEYSDDIEVYHHATSRLKELENQFDSFGLNGKETMKRIIVAHLSI